MYGGASSIKRKKKMIVGKNLALLANLQIIFVFQATSGSKTVGLLAVVLVRVLRSGNSAKNPNHCSTDGIVSISFIEITSTR